MQSLRGLSLCSGIGGLDLGLRLAIPQYKTVCYVEREAYVAAVLVARMHDGALHEAPVWSDIHTFDGRRWRGRVDIVHAGYPCQPFSLAGNRRGEEDPRHLWPSIQRIIGEVEPTLVFCENVPPHLRCGFDTVVEDMERLGFELAAGVFTAWGCGAPHIRERLFWLGVRRTASTDTNCDSLRWKSGGEVRTGRTKPTISRNVCSDGQTSRSTDAERGGGFGIRERRREMAPNSEQGGRARRAPNPEGLEWGDMFGGVAIGGRAEQPLAGVGGRQLRHADSDGQRLEERRGRFSAGSADAGLKHPCDHGLAPDTDGEPRSQRDGRGGVGEGQGERWEVPRGQRSGEAFRNYAARCGLFSWGDVPDSVIRPRGVEAEGGEVEPCFLRMDARVSFRVDRLRALGNSVVPVVAARAFAVLFAELVGDGDE